MVVGAAPNKPEGAGVEEVAAEVVGAPKSDFAAAGAEAAVDVAVGAAVVVAENKEGLEAGAELVAGVEPRPEKRPPVDEVVAAGAVVAGVVVAAGLAPKAEAVLGACSAGFVDAAPPKRVDVGVDEAPLAAAPNRPPGFWVVPVADAAPPKRADPELLAAG